jgi:hypothetical protein
MKINLEVDQHGTFLRLGRAEVYARWNRTGAPAWAIHREPGAVEVEAGRLRLTVSKVPLPNVERAGADKLREAV